MMEDDLYLGSDSSFSNIFQWGKNMVIVELWNKMHYTLNVFIYSKCLFVTNLFYMWRLLLLGIPNWDTHRKEIFSLLVLMVHKVLYVIRDFCLNKISTLLILSIFLSSLVSFTLNLGYNFRVFLVYVEVINMSYIWYQSFDTSVFMNFVSGELKIVTRVLV